MYFVKCFQCHGHFFYLGVSNMMDAHLWVGFYCVLCEMLPMSWTFLVFGRFQYDGRSFVGRFLLCTL